MVAKKSVCTGREKREWIFNSPFCLLMIVVFKPLAYTSVKFGH